MNECLICGPRGLRAAFNKPEDGEVVHISIEGEMEAATLNEPHTKHIHRTPAERSAWNLRCIW